MVLCPYEQKFHVPTDGYPSLYHTYPSYQTRVDKPSFCLVPVSSGPSTRPLVVPILLHLVSRPRRARRIVNNENKIIITANSRLLNRVHHRNTLVHARDASPVITATFVSGVRKTRSATGSLPPGSSYAKRSAKLAAQHTEQSQVPDPTDTNVSQDGNCLLYTSPSPRDA